MAVLRNIGAFVAFSLAVFVWVEIYVVLNYESPSRYHSTHRVQK